MAESKKLTICQVFKVGFRIIMESACPILKFVYDLEAKQEQLEMVDNFEKQSERVHILEKSVEKLFKADSKEPDIKASLCTIKELLDSGNYLQINLLPKMIQGKMIEIMQSPADFGLRTQLLNPANPAVKRTIPILSFSPSGDLLRTDIPIGTFELLVPYFDRTKDPTSLLMNVRKEGHPASATWNLKTA
ncbi:MAG: hypothetical protein G01um101418_945 [Parcubacteria group bacterium Gr01-1014_18]|nr:MAG: hypothetical protein Greene041636_947 [Parcubacteria group bacterium Greene0416_36]TSC79684.1 MAG: hypothetical protein G01um101418_945 [Parcubacteria group bacterium Gr01-1014_18]TSC97868.1 MAG: hypothetical protein Greene101420_973 [Parcubacteria group bacterium Greene1014_20]TSD06492.1 MAG: hypothetical protein Greene07142_873 [Parcubacteria group bacterium Greene0714_2]